MITKVLIANRGENSRVAGVSPNCRACAAGNGDLATSTNSWRKVPA
ncbi:MAG: hypothetical protein KF695_00505 [Simplicispira sp.]|jgi:hypothetical protein|nr:hypothetical protein [Simplicispira sp.]